MSMKKTAICILGVALLVALTASVAYADTTSTYASWTDSTVQSAQGSANTPHKGFAATTIKCAVCHAVHKGTAGGQALLPGSMVTACEYCHITNFIGNIKIYRGVAANYSGVDFNTAHSGGYSASCTQCHSVHGGNTITTTQMASVTNKILRSNAGTFQGGGAHAHQQTLPSGSANGWGSADWGTTTNRDGVISAFCTQCHQYYQGAYNGEIETELSAVYQSHVMTANLSTYNNTSSNVSIQGHKVADASSTYCRSCHMAGEANVSSLYIPTNSYVSTSSFPHYTPGRPRFLVSAAYSGASTSTDFTDSRIDGVCLNCHRWTATDGVGLDSATSY
jgi:hypothetical protein